MSSVARLKLRDIPEFLRYRESTVNCFQDYTSADWFGGGAQCIAALCAAVILKKKRPINIALPGYFCGQSLRFLRSMEVNVVFYLLTDSMTPDFKKIERQFRGIDLDIFVLVHYFGAVRAQEDAKIFAHKRNAYLLEDCAHIASYHSSEWLGDYLIFCPHKHFSGPPIGVIVGKEPLSYGGQDRQAPFPLLWLLKQIIRPLFKRPKSKWENVWSNAIECNDTAAPNKYLKAKAINDLERGTEQINTRKKNASLLSERISTVGGWQLFNPLLPSDYPYLVAIICDSESIAKKRYERLNKKNPLVMRWPDIPFEIVEDPCVSSQTLFWANRVLFFFVHEGLNTDTWLNSVDRIITKNDF